MSPRDDQQDRELLRRIVQRDRHALERLYLAYQPRLMQFLARLCSQRETLEEAVNDTFWTVWQKAGDFRGASRVSTWLIGIAWRHALKGLRRNNDPAAERLVQSAATEPRAIESLLDDEREQWLTQGLATLPLEQRATLELAYFVGHSCQEIADIMGCPVNTVKARMFQARLKLRNLLPKLGGIGEPTPLREINRD
jgi:RNA polymerase sigma-70 factor (ECF subfamily)